MSKQDRQGVRTPADIERKYDLGNSGASHESIVKQEIRLTQLSQTVNQYMVTTNAKLEELEDASDLSGDIAEIKNDISDLIDDVAVIKSLLASDGDFEVYTGEHTVIPDTTEQILPTGDKYVSKDITVKEIPYAEVSNNAGGQTVTIGPMR